MRFRRPATHYGIPPEPVTPYQKAGQVWDERLGSARVQARNWRMMAFGCLLLAGASMGDDMWWRAHRSVVVPYVVELFRGEVQAVHEGMTPYRPTDFDIANRLAKFIDNVRSISIDPVIVRQHWFEAYAYTTDHGAVFLNDFAHEHDPFAQVGKRSVTVDVLSVVRASDKSFQVQWDEHIYVNGSDAGTEHWTAILTTVLQPPNKPEIVKVNPLGVYVDGISWSRQRFVPPTSSKPSTTGGNP